MDTGRAARREARAAAERAEIQATELRRTTQALRDRASQEATRSNTIIQRALRSRGGGFFEMAANQLGAGGQGGTGL